MIPSSLQRTGRGGRGRGNIPLPVMIAGVVAALVVIVFAWVALSMGTPPVTEPVTADVPVKL